MDSTQFSKILFIQALEESDPQGQFIPHSTRRHATQRAKQTTVVNATSTTKDHVSYITKRAEDLWTFLTNSFPTIKESFHRPQPTIPTMMLIGPAFMVGLLMNGLGSSQRVNLLNFPLLLLLLWNITTYVFSLLFPLSQNNPSRSLSHSLSTWLVRIKGIIGTGPWPTRTLPSNVGKEWLQNSGERFLTLWWPQGQKMALNHIRHLLHLGAAALALGIIFSMYIRGLVFDYQANWESTFLSPSQVHTLLSSILGPATWLLGNSFPSEEGISQLQAPGHGSAAPWIHWWVLTGFLGIVVPRLILAWHAIRTANKTAQALLLPLEELYYLQLLAPDRGQGMHVEILPYSYKPSSSALELIGACLLNLIGNRATLHWHDPILYGQNDLSWFDQTHQAQTVVLICNLAQTPELEVHGELFHTLQTHIRETHGQGQLLILLDQEPYRSLTNSTRLSQRQQTWQRLAEDYHLHILAFDAKETSHEQFLLEAQTSLWKVT